MADRVDLEGAGVAVLPPGQQPAPAAVLVIDLAQGAIVQMDAAAAALTGARVQLPVGVDAWADAAGLTAPGGHPARGPGSPLSVLASGAPVAGELVAVPDRLLWMTGFPLGGVAAGLERLALMVLQPLPGAEPDGPPRLEVLRDRALVATGMSFTITDPRRDDNPLVWANPSFSTLTGYPVEETVGRNCRFLQGAHTDPATVRRIAEAVARQVPVTEVLLNYRRDGSAFWNEVALSPVFDGAGELVNFVGVQNDVTERVTVEQERLAALAEAEEARAQLRLLAEATTQMTVALGVVDACERLARSLVPELADMCAVDVLDVPGQGVPRRLAVAARDPGDEERLRELGQLRNYHVGAGSDTGSVLAGDQPVLVGELPERGADRYPDDPAAAAVYDTLRLRSVMVLPVRARGRVLGALTLMTQHPYGRRYGQRDLHLATDIAGRAGLAVDNARLYETEHAAAATLQRSLLPVVSDVDGVQVAARYRAGVVGNQVGGDWYDVLDLPDGALGLAIGDVVGHDLIAAAAMGQLRGVLRSYAWDGGPPGLVLDRCDQLVQGLEMAAMATAVYARLEPPGSDGHRLLRYANAGHPAPLVLLPDGTLARLDENRSPMIGAVRSFGRRTGPGRAEAELRCPPGTLLLLYTDGLTDIAGEDADARADLLESTVTGLPADIAADALVERVLAACSPIRPRDDVALLAVRLDG
ncbi:SpoIIE family protein phosphatase [Pseudonocardia sp. MH-G8]|uniref:SpoIIE family protein phosphatase n=1 Tax=Pseudonocardia sp. MH-G8 TaxID=1854588 RepID=UPI00117A65D6|nr:SpoIIE family protein phosphatase [Pseudonocardia sp. MH-G8]